MTASPTGHKRPRAVRAAAAAAAVLAGVYLAVVLPMIVLDVPGDGRARYDQDVYHLPTIERFAEQWPTPDVSDYPSATTPGYHLVLAGVRAWGGAPLGTLRLAGAAFGLALLAAWGAALGRRAGAGHGVVMGLPLATSLYVLASGVWLLPDNAGWLGVLGVWWWALGASSTAWLTIGGGVALVWTVAMRQSHLWAAAPLWVAAWSHAAKAPWRRLAWVALATAGAFAVVLAFAALWGGLVPPTFQQGEVKMVGPNPATPVLVLAVFGVVGSAYAGYWWPAARDRVGGANALRSWLIASAAIAGALALAVPTDMAPAAGRFGGVWRVADLAAVAGRSPVMVALAAFGGAAVVGLLAACRPSERWIAGVALLAFTAAQTVNAESFQRYIDPMAIMWAGLLSATIVQSHQGDRAAVWPYAWLGPAGLALLLGAVTAMKFL